MYIFSVERKTKVFGLHQGLETIEVAMFAMMVILAFGGGYLIGSTQIPQLTPGSPTQISVTGKFSTVNLGTSATGIEFVSSATGTAYSGEVTGGQYSVTVPNIDVYTVKIHWTATLSLGGDCTAGTLVLEVEASGGPINANWSC